MGVPPPGVRVGMPPQPTNQPKKQQLRNFKISEIRLGHNNWKPEKLTMVEDTSNKRFHRTSFLFFSFFHVGMLVGWCITLQFTIVFLESFPTNFFFQIWWTSKKINKALACSKSKKKKNWWCCFQFLAAIYKTFCEDTIPKKRVKKKILCLFTRCLFLVSCTKLISFLGKKELLFNTHWLHILLFTAKKKGFLFMIQNSNAQRGHTS